MPDLAPETAEALASEGFGCSDRWHSFDGPTCKNGCHTFTNEDGSWCHIPTLAELVEFVGGPSHLDVLTRIYAHRALLLLRYDPSGNCHKRSTQRHGSVVQFPNG